MANKKVLSEETLKEIAEIEQGKKPTSYNLEGKSTELKGAPIITTEGVVPSNVGTHHYRKLMTIVHYPASSTQQVIRLMRATRFLYRIMLDIIYSHVANLTNEHFEALLNGGFDEGGNPVNPVDWLSDHEHTLLMTPQSMTGDDNTDAKLVVCKLQYGFLVTGLIKAKAVSVDVQFSVSNLDLDNPYDIYARTLTQVAVTLAVAREYNNMTVPVEKEDGTMEEVPVSQLIAKSNVPAAVQIKHHEDVAELPINVPASVIVHGIKPGRKGNTLSFGVEMRSGALPASQTMYCYVDNVQQFIDQELLPSVQQLGEHGFANENGLVKITFTKGLSQNDKDTYDILAVERL